VRRGVWGEDPRDARIGEALDGALVCDEAVAPVEAERGGMIERAGVHPDARHAFAPCQSQRLRHQPVAVAPAREFGDEPEIGEFACSLDAEVEFEHAELDPRAVGGRIDLDPFVIEDPAQRLLGDYQPRKPQPRLTDPAEQGLVFFAGGGGPVGEPERRGRGGAQRRLRAHLERGDDRGDLVVGDGDQAHCRIQTSSRPRKRGPISRSVRQLPRL
jgi:hypothetical protein